MNIDGVYYTTVICTTALIALSAWLNKMDIALLLGLFLFGYIIGMRFKD